MADSNGVTAGGDRNPRACSRALGLTGVGIVTLAARAEVRVFLEQLVTSVCLSPD